MKTKQLAKEILLERIKSYLMANPGGMVGAHVIKQWYAECVKLAEAIEEAAEETLNPKTAAVFIPEL